MAFSAPTDKTGRCISTSSNNQNFEDIRSLLREGDASEAVSDNDGATGGSTRASSSNDISGAAAESANLQPEATRDRALRVLRRDLENSRGLERQGSGPDRDRPGRPEPYRTAKRLRQIGRIRSLDESSLVGSEASTSGGPPSPLSWAGLCGSSRHDSLSELNTVSGGEYRCSNVFSDEDTEDKSAGDSSNTSSSFIAPRYDKNKVPSILVSGTSNASVKGNMSDLSQDDNLALEMDKEYEGSTAVHLPHYAGELISEMNIMRESGDLVNAKINCGGITFSGHKSLFAAGSPYLANLMETHSKPSNKSVDIEVKDLRADLVGQLVDFIYTAKIAVSSQNAQELLNQAYNKKLFVSKSVELTCSEYLMGQFTTDGGSETSSTTGMASSVFSLEEDAQSSPESFFHDRNYPLDVLYALKRQRHQHKFTDLILKVEGIEFYCHRAILIAISPYFRAMLTSDMKESVEEEVTLHDIRADIFKRLLDFVYTCRLYLNDDNVQDIMELACFLQLLPAISACAKYLKDQLTISNSLGILSFAYNYNCSQLYDDAMNYALENFTEVTNSEEFLDLLPPILSSLIADDRLNIKKEESVYEAVMLWVRCDIKERLPQLSPILANVRLPLIDPEYFNKIVKTEDLLKQNVECEKLVETALQLREISSRCKHLTDVRLKLRFSMKTKVMVTVGGFDDEQQWMRDVWCYIPQTDTWQILASFPGRNRRFGCIALSDDIYVIGGQADHGDHMSETLSDVWRYDSITNTWSQIASMNKPRHGHGIAVLDGMIYAVGGKMGWAKRFNDVERYDPATNIWTSISRIKGSYVEKPCCSAVDGKLYVNGYFYRDPDIMHCYNPADNTWEAMYSFKRLQGDGIENNVVLDDHIYFMVYRGYDNFVAVYNPATGGYRRGSIMPDGKYLYSYGMTVVGDKIYVAGGSKLDASINVSYIQVYDPALDMWGVVGSIPYPLCEHGCVTIEKYIPTGE